MSNDTLRQPARITVLIACAERELAMRKNVYQRRVADQKMTQAKADAEIQAMADIVTTLRAVKELGGTEALRSLLALSQPAPL